MSGAVHLFDAAMSLSSTLSASRMGLENGKAEDLFALWQAVFRDSHVVTSAPPNTAFSQRTIERAALAAPAPDREPLVVSAAGAADQSTTATTPENTLLLNSDPSAAAFAEPAPLVTIDSGVEVALARMSQPASADEPDHAPPSGNGTSPDAEGVIASDAGRSPAVDAVKVFVTQSAVTIIARDPLLSDADAIQRAFATARELTGLGSSLHELTLNGRTVYRQQSKAAAVLEAHTILSFEC